MTTLAARLDDAIKVAGVAIVSVSIGDPANKATWMVQPASLQTAAQPIIDAFDPNDPAHDSAELTTEITGLLDNARLSSAIVWAILDTYSAPATVAKYTTARTKIIAAFKAQQWKA